MMKNDAESDTFIDMRADNEVLRRQLDGNKLKINLFWDQISIHKVISVRTFVNYFPTYKILFPIDEFFFIKLSTYLDIAL